MRIAATGLEEEVRLPHRVIADDVGVVEEHDVSIAHEQIVAAAPVGGTISGR